MTSYATNIFPNKSVEFYSPKVPETVKTTTLYRRTGRFLGPPHGTKTVVVIYNLKRDLLETQHPKFENSSLGFIG